MNDSHLDLRPQPSQPQSDGHKVTGGGGQGGYWTSTVPDEGLAEEEEMR